MSTPKPTKSRKATKPEAAPTPTPASPPVPKLSADSELPTIDLGNLCITPTDNIEFDMEELNPDLVVTRPKQSAAPEEPKPSAAPVKEWYNHRSHGQPPQNPQLDREIQAMQADEQELFDHRAEKRALADRLARDPEYRRVYEQSLKQKAQEVKREVVRREEPEPEEDSTPDELPDMESLDGGMPGLPGGSGSVFHFAHVQNLAIHYHHGK